MKYSILITSIGLIFSCAMEAATPHRLRHGKTVSTKIHTPKKHTKRIAKSKTKKRRKKVPAKQTNPLAHFNQQKKILENNNASLAARLHAATALQSMIKKVRASDKFTASALGLSLRKATSGILKIPTIKRLDKKAKKQIRRSLNKMNAELSAWIKHLKKTAKIKPKTTPARVAHLVGRPHAAKIPTAPTIHTPRIVTHTPITPVVTSRPVAPAHAPAAAQQQECPICLEQRSEQEVYRLSSCWHTVCRECLTNMINAAIDARSLAQLRCPNFACRRPLNRYDIANITRNAATIAAFDAIQAQEMLIAQNPNARNCPTPDCSHIFINDGTPAHTIQCPRCQHEYCSNCLLPHAAGMNCAEAQAGHTVDRENVQWIQEHTRPCPRCHTRIEKNGGCNHMFCTHCLFRFNWDQAQPNPV